MCEILGRIIAASEDALSEAVPAGECSLKMVVPAAMQELRGQYSGRING